MSAAATLSILAILLAAAGVAALAMRAKQAQGEAGPGKSFAPKPLMTPNEMEFFLRLEAALPEFRVFPQVAMGALMDAAADAQDRSARMSQRGKFQQKIVDFVIQRRSDAAVVALVELDDRTHGAAKDAARDAMAREAGHRAIRWQSKGKPDAQAIRAEVHKP